MVYAETALLVAICRGLCGLCTPPRGYFPKGIVANFFGNLPLRDSTVRFVPQNHFT